MTNIKRKMERNAFNACYRALGDDAPKLEFNGIKVRTMSGAITNEAIALAQNFQVEDQEGQYMCLLEEFRFSLPPKAEDRDTVVIHEPGQEPIKLLVTSVRRGAASSIVIMQTVKATH